MGAAKPGLRIVVVNIEDEYLTKNDMRVRKSIRHLKRSGHHVVVVEGFLPEPPPEAGQHRMMLDGRTVAWRADEIDGAGCVHVNQSAATLLPAVVASLSPDVVYAHELAAIWALLVDVGDEQVLEQLRQGTPAHRARPPVVRDSRFPVLWYECHEYEQDRGVRTVDLWLDKRYQERVCVPLVDEVIAPCPAIQEQLIQDYPGASVSVIPNSPERPKHAPDHTLLRRHLQLAPDSRIVAFVGNVRRPRMIGLLCEAFERVVHTDPAADWHMVWIGRYDPAIDPLEEYLPEVLRDRLHVLPHAPYPGIGRRPDLLDWLSGADVCVNMMPGLVANERWALPNKFFEAAFAGVPQVSSYQRDVVDLSFQYDLGMISFPDGEWLADAIRDAATPPTPKRRNHDFIRRWAFEATGGATLDTLCEKARRKLAGESFETIVRPSPAPA